MPGQNLRALVTGGTGFLGSHLVKMLVDQGVQVTVVKRVESSTDRLNSVLNSISFIDIDELTSSKISKEKYDYLFHLATCYGRNGETDEQINSVNIELPLSLLRAMSSMPKVVNFSTSLDPSLNTYTRSKFEFIKALELEFDSLELLNLELEHFYGPMDGQFIGYLINSIAKNVEKIPLTKGEQVRDFIFYKDLLAAVNILLKSGATGSFPIGSGKSRSLKESIEIIKSLVPDSQTLLAWGEVAYRENEVLYSVADISKLSKLGWQCEYSFEEGIREVIQSLK
ncbi:NAD(P)-dependent oxidoreductase [Halobacteriovorax sp. HLS]|uniref:NAD-dependent epimerase/dehydratase family protein n=1 Tax=Halobacteriovorax sp. HLS TaxID=2234000 RepID=UPI0013E35E06|nr:NAD(P)-dependent oxidoreductase [Halobacteriovorax sp. HLS]